MIIFMLIVVGSAIYLFIEVACRCSESDLSMLYRQRPSHGSQHRSTSKNNWLESSMAVGAGP
jgi:hypothetical protein